MITAVLSTTLLCGLLWGKLPQETVVPVGIIFGIGIVALKYFYGHSHQGISIDWLAQCSGWNRVSPLLKIIASVGVLFFCAASSSILFNCTVFFLAAILTRAGGVSWHQYISLLLLPLTFILMGTLGIVFGFSAHPEGVWYLAVGRWYLCITPQAQLEAVQVLSKALGGAGCLYFLGLSTPMQEIIGGLRKLHVPALMIELMYLVYRYIFILMDLHNKMDISASSRLGYRNWKTTLRTMMGISANLMVLSFRRASASFDAMEARGYRGDIQFLESERPGNGFHLLICALGILLLGLWYWIIDWKGWI